MNPPQQNEFPQGELNVQDVLAWSVGVSGLAVTAQRLMRQLLSYRSAFTAPHDVEKDIDRGRLIRIRKEGSRTFLECAFDTRDLEVTMALKDTRGRFVRIFAYANNRGAIEWRFEKTTVINGLLSDNNIHAIRCLSSQTGEGFFTASAILLETFFPPHSSQTHNAHP